MIESISIENIATYGSPPAQLSGLALLNFVFGSNGTGKTTISRIVAKESTFPTCKVTWKGGTQMQTLVYNQDFVDANFNQLPELKGVFTLGEQQKETLDKIAACKGDVDKLKTEIEGLTLNLEGDDGTGGKKGEAVKLRSDLETTCWAAYLKHNQKLDKAFEGVRNNKKKFADKTLEQLATNAAALVDLADLEKRAVTVYGETPTIEQAVSIVDASKLIEYEADPILGKKVIGKEDVSIAAMIKKLGNSDWVKEGRPFYEANERVCPFCQQETEERFAQSLKEYFDETFETDSKSIADLVSNYKTEAERVQKVVATIIASPSKFLDLEKFKLEKELLDSKIIVNNQRIASKKKEPSQVAALESLGNVASAITTLIANANGQILQHNAMVNNIANERSTLTAQVWKYILEQELKTDLVKHKTEQTNLDKAIAAMTERIKTARQAQGEKSKELRDLERQTTSIQPTIDAINAMLFSFGFQSFKLAKADTGTHYKLIRSDGSDAKSTLSEGEKNFITFLYFYNLLKGSDSESGMTTDRVVVFDDPVSSLDSEILFIVGSLIKGLFEEVRVKTGHIKQIFVLTHNVYFHKEVSFNSRRGDVALSDESFWVVRKLGLESKIERHKSNPITTSYELLWSEVRRPDHSLHTIQNVLRRILENYFKILGGIDFDDLCAKFDGKEKIICKSLCSWVHDGSHNATDDLYVAIDNTMVASYLNVFKAIFDKSEHIAHYKMMMKDAYVETPPSVAPVAS